MKWPAHLKDIYDKRLIYGSLFLAFLLIFVSIVASHLTNEKNTVTQTPVVTKAPDPFAHINISAKSALVYDIRTGNVIYARNAKERLPLASLTKVLTMVTAIQMLPPGTTITINEEALNTDGDNGLYLNEKWSLSDLINFSLVASSNDGAEAIAGAAGAFANPSKPVDPSAISEQDFVQEMNKTALLAGMTNSIFYNASGLDVSATTSGGYGSAEDMTNLMAFALKHYPSILADTKYPTLSVTSLNGITHTIQNTDPILNTVPGIIASKTGYTDLAGGNLTIVMTPGLDDPISITVLGSTYDGRFSDMQTLVNATMTYLGESK